MNAALRLVGVVTAGFQDELDTIGLGRHRETGSWVAEALDEGAVE